MAYGYRYDFGSQQRSGSVSRKRDEFSLTGLLKEAAIGCVMGGLAGTAFYGAGKAFGFLKDSVRDVREAGSITPATKPTYGQGFSDKGYNPKPGERTIEGYVKENANPEIPLFTNSRNFNNGKGNAGGQFKRIGAEEHFELSPHVHQPLRNITPDGTIYGKTGKTVGVDTLPPNQKDVKQLYEYINNGKYHE